MKINMTVELDWLEEDGSIDERMQDELIRGVKAAISKQCLARVEDKASKAIDTAIQDAIEASTNEIKGKVSEFVDSWMNTEVVLTDKYGDPTEKGSVRDLVKRQFDNLMNSMVSSDGKIVQRDGYGAKMSVIKFLTGEAVKEVVDTELSQYKKNIDQKIKDEINKGIKENVSDLFAQMVVNVASQQHAERAAIPHQNG